MKNRESLETNFKILTLNHISRHKKTYYIKYKI